MRSIHVNSTAPFFAHAKNEGKAYQVEDFELLTTILSALKWRKNNGEIKLYTDSIAKAYYASLDLLDVWNEIDTETIEQANETYTLNHLMFWAGAKIFAMQNETEPFFMMDTDFIVHENIERLIERETDLVCIHLEDLYLNVYIDPIYLKKKAGYEFPTEFDWSTPAVNGALVYHGNIELKNYYCQEAIRFMDGNLENAMESGSQMCFAEQRMLGMCARVKGVEVKAIMDHWKLWDADQPSQGFPFTHTWGWKQVMRDNDSERMRICTQLLGDILAYFPAYYSRLYRIPMLGRYFRALGLY